MRAVFLALVFATLASRLFAADWVTVKSPHIEVLTDVGEKTGRELWSRFETLRAIFREAGIGDSHLPIRAFVFSSESEFRQYQPDAIVDGFFRGGDRDYIAMHVGAEARRVAIHEYIHAVLSHSKISLPQWFDEGTADFYSNAEVDGRGLRIGSPINERLAALKSERWLDAGELSSKNRAVTRRPIFYSQSWALVHMLNLAPGWREGMPRFVLLMAENRQADEAFSDAFGKTIAQAIGELHRYVGSMRSVLVAPDAPVVTDAPRVEHLRPVATAVAKSALALHVDRPALAHSLIEKIEGSSAESEAARGEIALAEKHPEEARAHFDRAIALGSRDAEMWFQYAGLTNTNAAFEKVIEIDPDFAEAQFLLGERLTDSGDFASAIAHLKEAVRVRPRDSFYWHALGFAQVKAGLREDALASARRAKATSVTDPQEEMADALIALAQEKPREQLGITAGIITPPSWQNPKGDARVEGMLTQVDCPTNRDGFARLHVGDSAGKTTVLEVRHPDRVTIESSPGAQHAFSCGPQTVPVAIEYQKATGDVTRVEFRP